MRFKVGEMVGHKSGFFSYKCDTRECKTAEAENVLFQLLSSGDLWRTGG